MTLLKELGQSFPIDARDSQRVGVLVRSELSIGEMEAWSFVRIACPHQTLPMPRMVIPWRDPEQQPHPEEGDLLFYWSKYIWQQPQQYNLTLLQVPGSAWNDFQTSALRFPFPRLGCVLIVNLRRIFNMKVFVANQGDWSSSREKRHEFQKIWAGEIPRPKDMPSEEWIVAKFKQSIEAEWGGVTPKLKRDKLPFVVVPVAPTTPARPLPAVSLEEMPDLLDLEPHIPIISCPLEYSLEDIKHLNFPFSREDVERILSTLVEQIK